MSFSFIQNGADAEALALPIWDALGRALTAYPAAPPSDQLDPAGIYFGTQSGSVFVSPNEGDEWLEVARQLPPILSVEVGEWS